MKFLTEMYFYDKNNSQLTLQKLSVFSPNKYTFPFFLQLFNCETDKKQLLTTLLTQNTVI